MNINRKVPFTRLVSFLIAIIFAFSIGADDGVLEAVERFGIAYRTADVERLGEMLTEDYVHTNSSSVPIGREAWLKWVSSRRKALEAGSLVVLEYGNSELGVVRHGDTAIVTGKNRTVAEQGGKKTTSAIRFTMVWVLTDDGWKRAAFQDCRE